MSSVWTQSAIFKVQLCYRENQQIRQPPNVWGFVILEVSSLNSLKYKQIRGINSCFRKNFLTKLQTHHHTLAININYAHPLKCYGSENTNSSVFKQVNGNDFSILEDLLMKLLKYHHTMVINI